jgi:uncharacterized protein YwgA
MMSPLQGFAIVLSLVENLRDRGSWCGETHIQKAAYLLEEVMGVPLDFGFVLYKHGPYSFELKDQLDQMKAMGLLKVVPQPYPYRPRIEEDKSAEVLKKMYAKTADAYREQVTKVADFLNAKGVAELERLATAVYVIKETGNELSAEAQAEKLREYKPHVEGIMAESAVSAAKEFLRRMGNLGAPA